MSETIELEKPPVEARLLPTPFDQADLEALQVGSNAMLTRNGVTYVSLRAHVRKAVENGDIKQPLTGVQIAGLNKAACIALLMGETVETPEPMEKRATPPQVSATAPVAVTLPAPAQVQAAAPAAVEGAFAILAQAFGGKVNADEIKAQVDGIMLPHATKAAEVIGLMQKSIVAMRGEHDKVIAELRAGKPVTIEIKQPDGTVKDCGRQHYLFPLLLKIMESRSHAYLAGPAGSFKTSTAHAAANAVGLPFYATSVCQQTTKTDLLGFFVPGTGQYMPTDFRRAFENGGVFLLDEIDAGNANVLAVLNAALANSSMGFPDGMIPRHKDFILIAAGNTYGQGASRQYVGRNQLDAATLDRFAFVDFPYDEGLEAQYCGIEGKASPALNIAEGGSITADGWLARVHAVRKSAEKQGVRAVFSTRASIMGVKLAGQGIGKAWLERMLLWKGMDDATKAKVQAGA
jgi:cobaltochelatase CobS